MKLQRPERERQSGPALRGACGVPISVRFIGAGMPERALLQRGRRPSTPAAGMAA